MFNIMNELKAIKDIRLVGDLNPWERKFLSSISVRLKKGRTLTDNQRNVLNRLEARIKNADIETIRKLKKVTQGNRKFHIWLPVRKILLDMRKRGLSSFSDKQIALIEKEYNKQFKKEISK